jgi:hypothetical protein
MGWYNTALTEFRDWVNIGGTLLSSPVYGVNYLPLAGGTITGLLTTEVGIRSAKAIYQTAEITGTPTGTTQTLILNDGNHQSLSLASSTGNVTVTLTVPSGSTSGTIIITQHGTTARDITWAVSSGTFRWMGTEPTWSSDDTGAVRIISWRYNVTANIMYLMSTDVAA